MSWDAINASRGSVAQAAELIAQEIATAPGEHAEEMKGRADALHTIALAVSAVAFGPQGGTWSSHTEVSGKRPVGFGGVPSQG